MKAIFLLISFVAAAALSSCSSQVKAKHPVSYRFEHGRTALLRDGIAYAPKNAPLAVKRAIASSPPVDSMTS